MANKYGNKLAPKDPDLPKILRTTKSQDLAGSPKVPTVGALPTSTPKPPVGATKKARKGRVIS